MKINKFLIILILIVFIGLRLRLINYDKTPPWGETMDELLYPWQGMSLIQKGVPTAWSWQKTFENTRTMLPRWNDNFSIVSPWLEKPPLYSLIVGSLTLIFHTQNMYDIRISFIRIIPILLSCLSIFLIGIFTKKITSENVALIAALIYATISTIILSNRLSLTENLLTPIVLLALIILLINKNTPAWNWQKPVLLGILAGCAVLTKQMGIVLIFAIAFIYFIQKKYYELKIFLPISIAIAAIYPWLGWLYGWNIFWSSQSELKELHLYGLPQVIYRIFLLPTIGHPDPNRSILDGSMLAGYILLFASPWWVKLKQHLHRIILLIFPILYLVLLCLIESGEISFYGWYLFPLFPFMAILLAIAFNNLWNNYSALQLLVSVIILASSQIRFLLKLFPFEIHKQWQPILAFLLVLIALGYVFKRPIYNKFVLILFFIIYISANIIIAMNLSTLYFINAQPLQ